MNAAPAGGSPGNGQTVAYTGNSFSFAGTGSTVVVSQFFQAGHSNATQTPFAMLGILSDSNERMDGAATTSSCLA